ncbi:MAG: tetratricopeptide repeat protein [Ferruginibacter sp.]
MLKSKALYLGTFVVFLFGCTISLFAQPIWTIDPFGKEKKPEKYEEKKLASEKTGEKKFKGVRKFLQNNTSHYNFYFNANNRINLVLERAKLANKDDYAKLLSFYPYSLDNTASQKSDLDSVIYKSTAGILLHDLRSEWVDNFYLLIGKSYLLKKDFDSAALTFQFINYNLFPRKKKDDDYNKIVGSNETGSGAGSVSIADKEKRNIIQKAFTKPPSRNEALIWQIRTFTEQEEYGDAAGLISILENDKNLPGRLKNDLEEVTSYWFFCQNNYDSSAVHLQKALSNADTKEDKSRWEYLLAQLYERTGKFDDASTYYLKAAQHTTDPVMDIYAKLSEAKMLRNTGNFKELDNTISNLLNMAKKDKYESFRDIIYYSTGQLSLQKPDTSMGITYYNKSISYNNPESGYRDKSFLQLGNIAYRQNRYKEAYAFYDSLSIVDNKNDPDSATIEDRKELLSRLVPKLNVIEQEDSLQRIAVLPVAERDAMIKKMIKKYRKENGLKEEDEFAGNTLITFADRNKAPVDLFTAAAANAGDWYFYNASLKSKGFNEFKSKWGKRTNVDNWRRKSAIPTAVTVGNNPNASLDPNAAQTGDGKKGAADSLASTEYTFDGLMEGLPLTKEKIDTSNINIAINLYEAAQIFQNELQDYYQAIALYEDFVKRFPNDIKIPDVYFGLSFCYNKIGNTAKASQYANLVKTNFAGSDAAKIMLNPALLKPLEKNREVTAKYETVYNMFVEGRFEEAINAKKKADSTGGKNYWSPQLLYIESVYYIKERQDSAAIATLKNIESLYPTSPLKEKAKTLIGVLQRRSEIEKYLTDLQVTRQTEDQIVVADSKPNVVVNALAVKPAEIKTTAPAITKPVITNTIKTPDVYINKSFTLSPDKPHYVAMILDKVDGVYVNEAKNAFARFNKESMATINVAIVKDTIDATKSLLLFQPFENAEAALKYFDRIKKAAPSEVSWLQPTKYSFIIIADDNLLLLKSNRDIIGYKQLLNANFSNKF